METSLELVAGSDPNLIHYSWPAAPRSPLRKLYLLQPGQHWSEAETTDDMHEWCVDYHGEAIPSGAAVCRELEDSSEWVFFTETFTNKLRLFDGSLYCQPNDGPWQPIVDDLIAANGDRLGGFSDVVGLRHDGTILLYEIKAVVSGDTLKSAQTRFAENAMQRYGSSRVEFALVTWGTAT